MKRRSPAAPLLLPLITFGIYTLVWFVKTKNEMNEANASNPEVRIPTAWLFIVPFVNIWWMWRYAVGVEAFTNRRIGTVGAFLLMFLLGVIGDAIVQSKFNATIDGR
ncbi:hypothetical protein GCM10022198_00550 [Klugiella xanthotipulae]|uniref:Uncharacterized protein DUF4234 n=1 Tax=Klugiella xanthotipulae TaxID=244735 RepID=A0A543I5C0_9MICO|nr:DUF4234 domain-containing protein [Klugiella xanthotipulae]TQM65806.1 uncharacterized protein DUF4234 [Klugiella xanthotipulae]